MKTPTSVRRVLLLPLFLAIGFFLGVPFAAQAGVVAGDFEAKLGNLLVKVAITTPPGKSPVFSGQVVSDGTVKGVNGSFKPGAESDWEGSIAVAGTKEIMLRYSTVRFGGESSEENLQLGFASVQGFIWVEACQAYKPDGNATLTKTFSLAYRLGQEVKLEKVQGEINEKSLGIVRNQGLYDERVADIKAVEEQVAAAVRFLDEKRADLVKVQKQYPDYYGAYNAAAAAKAAASSAYEAASNVAFAGMRGVFSSTKGLVTAGVSFENATTALLDGLKAQAESIRTEVDVTSPTAAAGIVTKMASAKEKVLRLMTSKAADYNSTAVDRNTGRTQWSDRFEEYLAELDSLTFEGVPPSRMKDLFPSKFSAAATRALFVKLGPHLNNVLDAARLFLTGQLELERLAPDLYVLEHPDFNPAPGEDAQLGVDLAQADLKAANELLDYVKDQAAEQFGEVTALAAEKAALSAGLALLDYRGYGVASIAVTGRATAPGGALISGVAPNGTRWTYAAKVRIDQYGNPGTVFLNVLTGPRVLEGEMVLNGIAEGAAVASEVKKITWSALECEAVAPTLMTGVSKAKNPFGLSDRLGVTTAVVALGEDAVAGEGENQFGVLLSSASVVSRYLFAGKGTELKVALTPSVSFSGKFPYAGAGLLGFQGVFACPDPANPAAVEGFGHLLLSPTTSVPVKITVAVPAAGGVPSPQLPVLQSTVVWKGLKSGVLTIQLDAPTERNLTTVALMRGSRVVATATANPAGLASLDIAKVATGDYSLRVMREHLGGVLNPVSSPSFKIFQRTPPAGTFQCLLAYDALRGAVEAGQDLFSSGAADSGAPDGNPYRARVRVTTTPTGALSGLLEFIDLRQVYDEAGNLAPDWSLDAGDGTQRRFKTRHPVLVEYPLSGGLVPSAEVPEGLAFQLATAPKDGAPALSLALLVADAAPSGSFEKPTTVLAPTLKATLTLDPGGAGSMQVSGSCSAASKGVAAAKGKYDAAGIGIDYSSGAATVAYSTMFGQENAKVKVTGSASIGRDGQIPLMLPPTITARQEAPGKGWVASTAYGFLAANLAVSPGKKPPYGVQGVSRLYVTGSTLEEISGGYRYNTVWSADPSYVGPRQGGFGSSKPVATGVGP